MFTQEEIDAVLMDATEAVDNLSNDVNRLESRDPALPAVQAPSPSTPAAHTSAKASQRPAPSSQNRRVQRILKLKVPVIVRLAERVMLVGEVMKIKPGTILEFERTVEDELDLLVGDRPVGGGVAVKVGEHFGLRITQIGNVRERIESLAK